MVQFLESIQKAKSSNLLVLLEKSGDEIPLKIDIKIQKKISRSLAEKKSFFHSFFLGETSFEYLYVAYFCPQDIKGIHEFLAEQITKLPRDLTLFSHSFDL
jgi:hypothetical protein